MLVNFVSRNTRQPDVSLSQVPVAGRTVFVFGSLEVLSHNQVFDALLDQADVGLEAARHLLNHFTDKLSMGKLLA